MTDHEGAEPYALTEQHVAALERAIRAEGYQILVDTETGAIRLALGGNRQPLPNGKLLNVFAMWAALARIRAAARAVKGAENVAERLDAKGGLSWEQVEQICTDALDE